MAEITKQPSAAPGSPAPAAHTAPHRPKYALPLPIRTFPLPTFYPSNPLSLFHLAFAWLGQVFFPPPAEPAVVHRGVWSPETRSVHITDPKSMNDLWCQGFFGKGSLSRSEPNWLNREKARLGLVDITSEQRTNKRREERADTKWERGRSELEAIERRRREEEAELAAAEADANAANAASAAGTEAATNIAAGAGVVKAAGVAAVQAQPVIHGQPQPEASSVSKPQPRSCALAVDGAAEPDEPILRPTFKPPVGPLELLALPNSEADLLAATAARETARAAEQENPPRERVLRPAATFTAPIGPLELLALPNSEADLLAALAAGEDRPSKLRPRPFFKAPVGPLELLALPNSEADLLAAVAADKMQHDGAELRSALDSTVEPVRPVIASPAKENGPGGSEAKEDIAGPPVDVPLKQTTSHRSDHDHVKAQLSDGALRPQANGCSTPLLDHVLINGLTEHSKGSVASTTHVPDAPGTKKRSGELVNGGTDAIQPLKRQKSVRFSPNVKSTIFQHSDPPSPNLSSNSSSSAKSAWSAKNGRLPNGHATSYFGSTNGAAKGTAVSVRPGATEAKKGGEAVNDATVAAITNKEHLQLSAEEAFFLAYALGALVVVDPATNAALSTQQLFTLFRQQSYFPPRGPTPFPHAAYLATDDPFLVHYAVYHHFRSLGWVPRHGIKFGVDWLLYGKGPALDHAEFGVIVMPSYTDPRWADSKRQQQQQQQQRRGRLRRSWHWLHGVNRVLSTVYKGFVLAYVDIPPPAAASGDGGNGDSDGCGGGGGEPTSITDLLSRYTVREVTVRRWSSNRNRD
ncbi:tRNA intron endonuclease [Niveomyces insectorum RCEF 264]|uniref:tRNA-intron lyase n=1 Tax=Niveomyces insectorum RCEF 264 TaxID=1081102 RepID=A0A167S4D2_9HYPO|nr:tRNA intron endonuclease [Niveomyces insectorum RCEF 264]